MSEPSDTPAGSGQETPRTDALNAMIRPYVDYRDFVIFDQIMDDFTKLELELAAAKAQLAEARGERDPAGFNLNEYIAGLKWSEQATDHEKTLVVGNLRSLFAIVKVKYNSLLFDARNAATCIQELLDEADALGKRATADVAALKAQLATARQEGREASEQACKLLASKVGSPIEFETCLACIAAIRALDPKP